MTNPPTPAGVRLITLNEATGFLREAAAYFRKRDTKGEDRAYWANVYNAENCEKIIDLLFSMRSGIAALTNAEAGR